MMVMWGINDYYIVANCGFDNLDEDWSFKTKMGFPDWVCSANILNMKMEILWGNSCDERAIELLNKYDGNHPN